MLKIFKRWGSLLLLASTTLLLVEKACSQETYGPYRVIGYNYTDRNIFLFDIDDFGAGSSETHQAGGGGGIACCLEISNHAKTLHVKIMYGWTEEQCEKSLLGIYLKRTYRSPICRISMKVISKSISFKIERSKQSG
ncbi:hypothetical protein [Burkholderia vietnamiensis]|uniref:hypothetical protein n=1 Tax=Burkholderia vietnamiensis TaxID=60552 RepID=UPI001590E7FD|nr:hypothetical protein [Burkholderia vietnamiensis]